MSRKAEKQLIKEFGEAQMAKLDVRSKKYERLGWREKNHGQLLMWLLDEVEELKVEFETMNLERIKDEAIDIANLSMFIYDKVSGDSRTVKLEDTESTGTNEVF